MEIRERLTPEPLTKDLKSLTLGSLSQRILEEVMHKDFEIGLIS